MLVFKLLQPPIVLEVNEHLNKCCDMWLYALSVMFLLHTGIFQASIDWNLHRSETATKVLVCYNAKLHASSPLWHTP